MLKKSDWRGCFSHASDEKITLISEISKIDEKRKRNVSRVEIYICGQIFIVIKVIYQHLLIVLKEFPRGCFSHAHPNDIKNVPEYEFGPKMRFLVIFMFFLQFLLILADFERIFNTFAIAHRIL